MRYFLFLLTVLAVAFFQAVVWNFNFLLLLVLVSSLLFSPSRSLFLAFLAGIFLDLFSGAKMGFSSLAFLFPCFLLSLYRQRFSLQNPVLIFLVTFVASFLFAFIVRQSFAWFEGLILAFLMLGFRLLLPFLFVSEEERQPFKLKV